MKNKLVLLAMAASVMAPLSLQADPASSRTGDNVARVKTKAVAPASHRVVYYITNRVAVGSHIPLVVARSEGHYVSLSPMTVYGQPDLDRTGQLSVYGELVQRDPAISSVHR